MPVSLSVELEQPEGQNAVLDAEYGCFGSITSIDGVHRITVTRASAEHTFACARR